MIHSDGSNGKTEDKARAIVDAGWVRLTEGGASVRNAEGHVYRVDYDLGGRAHCQCRGFEYSGWCKHLTAAYLAQGRAAARHGTPEGELTDEEWDARQADDDRAADFVLDAGLDNGDMGSAAYALGW